LRNITRSIRKNTSATEAVRLVVSLAKLPAVFGLEHPDSSSNLVRRAKRRVEESLEYHHITRNQTCPENRKPSLTPAQAPQYAIVKAGHDRVRDMRNSYNSAEKSFKNEGMTDAEDFEIESIRDHMDVIASCGKKVGVVDHLEEGTIKLTRNDSPDNLHHYLPASWVSKVDSRVHLNKNSHETELGWKNSASACGCGTC